MIGKTSFKQTDRHNLQNMLDAQNILLNITLLNHMNTDETVLYGKQLAKC